MPTHLPLSLLRIRYAEAAEAYLRSLPPEHFMEAIGQATQRKITVCSFEIVHADRPELQLFNELLVQYPSASDESICQVVPDNMLVRHSEPIKADGSFDVVLQPARPFWMMEYVSKHTKRKDYEDNYDKYERDLKVPYYLLFYPDDQEVTLYRHNGRKYVSVKPNEDGRYAVREVDMELGLVEGWVRYWYKGNLLPLPGDLQRELEQVRQQLAEALRLAKREKRRADRQSRRAEQEAHRAEQEAHRAEQEAHRAEQEAHRAEKEQMGRLAAEQEIARLRERLARFEAQQQENTGA